MALFDFPYFNFETEYEDNSPHVKFGGNWEFSAQPEAKDQRILTLTFDGMSYFANNAGAVLDTITPQQNLLALENFYRANGTWNKFQLNHPVYGTLNVRFRKPLKLPKIKGLGVGDSFTIELIELLQ